MSQRLSNSEITFSPQLLIPMLERYAVENQNGVGNSNWLPSLFIDVGFPFETIVAALQGMWYNNIPPFTGTRKRILVQHILFVLLQWYEDCVKTNTRLYGSDENAQEVAQFLEMLEERPGDLLPAEVHSCVDLKRKIQRAIR